MLLRESKILGKKNPPVVSVRQNQWI